MSENVPIQLVVAAYTDEKGASQALEMLKKARKERLIGIQAAAVLRKDSEGKLHIKETADMGGRRGAALGGVAGGAIGLIAGPALVVPVAVGALIGGLAAKFRDSGFSDTRLKQIGEGLKPGSSAIVAVVEHTWVEEVQKELAAEGANTVTEALRDDIASQLEAGHDVAYTALSTQEGMAAGRISTGADKTEAEAVVIGSDAVVGARYVATKDGYEVQSDDSAGSDAADATDDKKPASGA